MLSAGSEIEVVVMRESPDCDTARAAVALLSPDERQRANRFVLLRDRQRFITRRAHLRRLLGERLGVPAESIRLCSGIHGKPALAEPLQKSGVTFNLSHSGDLTAYAFATRIQIGVDVERIRVVDEADRIAALMFSPGEYETYERLPAADKPLAFLNGWTRKEAFVKATGSGLRHSLDTFDVSLAPGEPARVLRLGTNHNVSSWRMHSFFPAPGFVAALAAQAA